MYGGVLNPREAASTEFSGDVSTERSAALLTFRPNEAIRCGVSAFRSQEAFDWSQMPRLPTYAASTTRFWVTWRCTEMFH